MESIFLNLGFSYTWSKALPYILLIIIGILLGVFIYKKSKNIYLKVLSVLVIFIPFIVYFSLHPIYQGDFTNEAKVVQYSETIKDLNGHKLVVISMPGCPYCKESVLFFKEIKKRHPKLKVEYAVTSDDSRNLAFYEAVIKGEFPLHLAESPERLNQVARGRFPTFVLVNGKQPMKVWSNNTFGVAALDEVVNSFN